MSHKIFREAAVYVKQNKKRLSKMFVVDTLTTTLFWFVVHVFKDVFIVRLELWQVLLAGGTGIILNLLLSGVYGQVLNMARKVFKCQ